MVKTVLCHVVIIPFYEKCTGLTREVGGPTLASLWPCTSSLPIVSSLDVLRCQTNRLFDPFPLCFVALCTRNPEQDDLFR